MSGCLLSSRSNDWVDPFLLKDPFQLVFSDEAGVSGILDDKFHVTAGLVGRLAVEGGDSYDKVGYERQHDNG